MTRSNPKDNELRSLSIDLKVMVDHLLTCGVASQVIEVLRIEIARAIDERDIRDLRSTRKELLRWTATLPQPQQAELDAKLASTESDIQDGCDADPHLVAEILKRGQIADDDEFALIVEVLSDVEGLPPESEKRARLGQLASEYENSHR